MKKIYKEAIKSEIETNINVLYSIAGSLWEIPLEDKTRIQKLIVKANIFEL